MSLVNDKDVFKLLEFVLSTENQSYKENPVPSGKEKNEKLKEYRKKVEDMTLNISKREGLKYEN